MSSRLSPGDIAPDFTLSADTGEEVSLSDLRGSRVIVYFYPAAMTPGCTKQACDFTESLDSLKAAGYEVAAHGLNQWNGVAIISRVGLDNIRTEFL